jgi:hypothetical protein
MTPEELLSLPVAMQVRILIECLNEDTMRNLRSKAKPKPPLPPKYDQVIFRSGGVMYASECDLESLRYWRAKYAQSSDPQYAERDQKRAEALARWITWRECFPDATWSGERDRASVVAKPPSSKPMVYPRNGGGNRPPPPPEEDLSASDDDIPW